MVMNEQTNGKRIKRVCVRCGDDFKYRYRNRQYCAKCKKEVREQRI
jgi:ribosomal protein S27AE